jgi:hypothetical protein
MHTVTPSGEGASQLRFSIDQAGPVGSLVSLLYKGLTDRYINMEANGVKRRAEGAA